MEQSEGRRFAVDEAGVSVDAIALKESLASQSGRIFSCAGCGGRMFFKPGNVRRPHFAHYTDDRPCGGETYLHKLGKRVFRETFEECVKNGRPFRISFYRPVICEQYNELFGNGCRLRPREPLTFDLTRYYDTARKEVRDDGLVIDLLLEKKGKPGQRLWIEIKVTHQC